jgi:competence protein CoiA
MHRPYGVPESETPTTACDGLADGWARRLANHQPVHATGVAREEGPFYCAECHAEVALRQGAHRTPHFAHRSPVAVSTGGEEGTLHRLCKGELHAALAAAHPEGGWEVERTIPARPQRGIAELRPDVSGRVRGLPLAIEIQASALDIAAIVQRTGTYAARRIPVLWLVPLHEQPPDDALRPRLHERYLHSLYLGRTYYWWPGLGSSVVPIHYGACTQRVPRSQWYRHGLGPVQAGGYERAYRSLKTPLCGPRLQIDRDFVPRPRDAFVPANERKAVPACLLWLDRLARWW